MRKMGKIKLLKSNVYKKIAAGEVIERPHSVVKELVENAIDAGADDIAVQLMMGGKAKIVVEDNGEGFDPSDVETAFQRHSTSKITELNDLDNLLTLGFRGEALPSIGEVSRVRLSSSSTHSGMGVRVVLEQGKTVEKEEIAFRKGTRIEVKDLFYNFPVRRKFLKSDRTELNRIVSFMEQIALAHHDISFSLSHNGRSLFDHKGSASLRERVYQIYGKGFLDGLQELHFSQDPHSLNGFVSRLNTGVGHKRNQYFFVNRRPVREKTLIASLNQTCQRFLEKSRHPVAIMMLDIPPSEIDVNIHPMKLEIKFKDTGRIYQLVKRAITLSLTGSAGPLSGIGPSPDGTFTGPDRSGRGVSEKGVARQQWAVEQDPSRELFPGDFAGDDFTLIGQYRRSYILIEKDDALLIVDQHNAHERINFDKFKDQFLRNRVVSISPLFPLVLELSPSEKVRLDADHMDLLRKLGFELRPLSGNAFDVKKFPQILEERSVKEVIRSLLVPGPEAAPDFSDRVLAEVACKSAIKVNHTLHPEEMRTIVRDLFNTSNPHFCPHKRPIIIRFSLEEIEKKMKRK